MTICNPVNISYRFRLPEWTQTPCREAADPSVVFYKDEFLLFASKSGGYWHSPDLRSWQFVASRVLPVEDYAPDAAVINGCVYVTASNRDEPSPIFRSSDPANDAWQKVSDCPEHHDPALFQDDDGRVYRYWGCSNHLPLYGCEMDPESMLPISETVPLYDSNAAQLGWERRGDDHSMPDKAPHIEGPWVIKHGGRFYLEYATPGTQYNVYADAVLVSNSPLGPFQLQTHNPHSYKPTGFIPGAGHGSSFQDRHGNWWHISTMRISVRHKFERRLGLWPAGFDEDGIFFCNTAFGDYPMHLPDRKWDPWQDTFAGWMLLSHRCDASASSSLPDHAPALAFDEDVQTWWAAADDTASLKVDLGAPCTVHAVQINFAEHDATIYGREGDDLFFQYSVEVSQDKTTWTAVIDKRESTEDLPHDYAELDEAVEARFLRLTILHVPSGKPAVCGFRVFGVGPGDVPGPVETLTVTRSTDDPCNAKLEWSAVPGATGYNVRWGIGPEKLYNSCIIYDATSLDLRCLNAEVDYSFAVEAFNRSGVNSALCQIDQRTSHPSSESNGTH